MDIQLCVDQLGKGYNCDTHELKLWDVERRLCAELLQL
jgi:hypothetical protein